MISRFELFVAARYLRARRKEAVISIITVISIVGVAAGVMALVIALGVTNGFRGTLQRNLLGAMAHIDVTPREPGNGIDHWQELSERLRQLPHIVAVAPALYDEAYISGPLRGGGVAVKGIEVDSAVKISDALRNLKAGSLERLADPNANPPGIVVGARLAEETGIKLNSLVNVLSPSGGTITGFGQIHSPRRFRVVGIFESGFYDVDHLWTYTSIPAVQRMDGTDSINRIEVNVDDVNKAAVYAKEIEKLVGKDNTTTTWMEQNQQLMSALSMERIVTVIVIGLIEIVAALNIFITLVMMVMEKYRDIAVLMSMGARHGQIRRIFMLQGVLIGVVGSAIGLVLGYALCYYANKYQWIKLPEEVYALPFVPFEPHAVDAIWIAAMAILVSFVATLYPARNATRITPAEVLRYE